MTKMSRVFQGVVLTFALVAPSADALGFRRMDTTGSSASTDTGSTGVMATAASVMATAAEHATQEFTLTGPFYVFTDSPEVAIAI